MPVWSCIVPGCGSNSRVPSHCIPKKRIAKEWVEAIRNPALYNLSLEELHKFKVCHKHFPDSDLICESSRRRLRIDSVPTLNLPEGIEVHVEQTEDIGQEEGVGNEQTMQDDVATSFIPTLADEPLPCTSYQTESNDSKCNRAGDMKRRNRKRPLLGHITRTSMCSPDAQRLHRISSRLSKRNNRLQKQMVNYRRRLKEAEKFVTSNTMKEIELMTPVQRNFIEMHLQNVAKEPRVQVLPGVNDVMVNHLREQGLKMSETEKLCTLMWDEMSLQPHIQYDVRSDQIIGFENWGNARTSRFADHALVFMLKGIVSEWKIPFSYNFCQSQTASVHLIRCIKEIVKAVQSAGFTILATVCDQSQANMKCIRDLIEETKIRSAKNGEIYQEGTMKINKQSIIPLYDPPHLLKGIRNNLLNKDVKVDWPLDIDTKGHTGSWSIIELAYDIDKNVIYKKREMMPKLTELHIRKERIAKMKVKYAAQILSKTVSSFITFLVNVGSPINTTMGPLSLPKEEAIITSEVVEFFNDLFDSVNGHTLKSEVPLRAAVTETSGHMDFWTQARKKLASLKFICPISKREKQIPSVKNWIKTIKGFQLLWKILKNRNVHQFLPRRVNQGSLENFFGMIRSHGYRNINPTCWQFQSSFKTLLINNLISSKTVKTNCESIADGNLLFSLENFVKSAASSVQPPDTNSSVNEVYSLEAVYCEVSASTSASTPCNATIAVLQAVRKSKIFTNCNNCCKTLTKLNSFQEVVSTSEKILKQEIAPVCFKKNIGSRFNIILTNSLDFSFLSCKLHFEEFQQKLVNIILLKFLLRWCMQMNKILGGKDTRSADNVIMKQAVLYRKKT